MSQFPQYPQQPPPPPPPMQPYAPMGMPPPTRISGAAITSLVLGLIGCIPFLTSLLAVIFGIVGIRKTGNPNYRGRGLAIAGLILGLIGLAGWTLAGGGLFAFYVGSRPVAQVAQQFTAAVAQGNVAAAANLCDSTVISNADVQTLAVDMGSWGGLKNLTLPARNVFTLNGVTTWNLTGAAQFGSATKVAQFKLVKQADGTYKITEFSFK